MGSATKILMNSPKLAGLMAIAVIALASGAVSVFVNLKPGVKMIKSFSEVNFQAIEPGSVVVFDVDYTLTQFEDSFCVKNGKEFEDFYKSLLKFERYQKLGKSGLLKLRDSAILGIKFSLIEKGIAKQIKTLIDRGVFVIACTHAWTGKLGETTFEQWRFEILEELGITMSFADKVFDLQGFDKKPKFFKGIILTDRANDKGPLITASIEQLKLNPKKVMFFDDVEQFVKSVSASCKEKDLECEGYHYKGFDNFGNQKTLNYDLALFKHDHLLEHGQWLSDEQAEPLMQKSKSETAQAQAQ